MPIRNHMLRSKLRQRSLKSEQSLFKAERDESQNGKKKFRNILTSNFHPKFKSSRSSSTRWNSKRRKKQIFRWSPFETKFFEQDFKKEWGRGILKKMGSENMVAAMIGLGNSCAGMTEQDPLGLDS